MSRPRNKKPEYNLDAMLPNGNRLRQMRDSFNMTAQRVADYLGVTPAHVSAIEKGKTGMRVEDLRALSILYQKPIDFFFLPDDP